ESIGWMISPPKRPPGACCKWLRRLIRPISGVSRLLLAIHVTEARRNRYRFRRLDKAPSLTRRALRKLRQRHYLPLMRCWNITSKHWAVERRLIRLRPEQPRQRS